MLIDGIRVLAASHTWSYERWVELLAVIRGQKEQPGETDGGAGEAVLIDAIRVLAALAASHLPSAADNPSKAFSKPENVSAPPPRLVLSSFFGACAAVTTLPSRAQSTSSITTIDPGTTASESGGK